MSEGWGTPGCHDMVLEVHSGIRWSIVAPVFVLKLFLLCRLRGSRRWAGTGAQGFERKLPDSVKAGVTWRTLG